MLLRICLILAILSGIGVIVVSQVKVRDHIQKVYDESDRQTQRADFNMDQLKKTNAALVRTTERLNDTTRTLQETRSTLKTTEANLVDSQKARERLSLDLDKAQQDKKDSDAKLVKWEATRMTPEGVVKMKVDFKNAQDEISVIELEKALLKRNLDQKIAEIALIYGTNSDPEIPITVRGKVVAVDPKWDFVVLDVGAKQGVPVRGVLMVHRDSKLVGKVRVSRVFEDRSIANLVPGWKLTDIVEGDQVLPTARTLPGG